jgi:nitroreductase
MDVLQAIKERRSVRAFRRSPVGPEVLERLVDAGSWAPTAGNRQAWRFVIVTDEKRLSKLRMVSPGLLGEPPATIVVCQDLAGAIERMGEVAGPMVAAMDSAIAAYAITLAAQAEGLGTCIVASFNTAAVKRLLRVPDGSEPLLMVTVGYPARIPEPPRRTADKVRFVEVCDG